MAGNDVEWTSDEMIKNANSWSLAGDVALLNRLKQFSESLLSKAESVSANVDNLLNNLENVSLKLDLTKNEFQSLRNTQFIENRVYEDDETLESNENKKEEKELTEEEKENAIKESILTGLKVMEKYYEKIEVAVSDSEEEENEKSFILQPKDPYADRPLPYLVGTQDWYKKWHVGLLPSESESESEKEEEVYSSSDSEECLPKDKNLGSETSSELDFTNRNTGPVANSTFNDSQDPRREIFHSSDESSEPSNSLPVKAPISNEKFAQQLAAKLGDVISSTAENGEHVNRNPIKKMNQPTKYGTLFSDEPPPLDDLDDTVLPKSAHEGLFSGGRDLFSDSTEDDLFWDQPNKTSQNIKNIEEKPTLYSQPDVKPNLKVSKGLFDKSDSSSEDDMFTAAEKRKVKATQPYLRPFKSTMPFVDDKPPEMTAKSDGAPSKKKPIGGVSIFGENANIFGENSGKPGFESPKTAITQDSESKSTGNIKKSLKKTSLFDESSDEDITTPKTDSTVAKKSANQQTIKKLSLFGDADDILTPKPEDTLKKPEGKKKLTLFDDGDDFSTSDKEDVINSKQNKKHGLFDEDSYENVDILRPTTKETAVKTGSLNKTSLESKKPVKKISLFDDDDDFLKEEEDIFAPVPKKRSLFNDFAKTTEKNSSKGLFEDPASGHTLSKDSADEDTSKEPSKALFDDLKTQDSSEIVSKHSGFGDNLEKDADNLSKEEKYKTKPTETLFDDLETSGNSEDLFEGPGNQSTIHKEGHTTKKVTPSIFEDIESSTSTTSLIEESREEDIDVKSLEKKRDALGDGNKSLDGDQTEEKPTKDVEDLGASEEKNRLFKDSDILEKSAEKSQKDMLGNKKVVKQKWTGLFKDSGNDKFLGDGNKDDIEAKSEKLKKETTSVEGKGKQDVLTEEVTRGRNLGEGGLENVKNEEEVDDVRNLDEDESNNSNKGVRGQTEGVLKQSTNDLLGKIRKNVGFLESDGKSSSEDNFGFGKKTKDEKTIEDNGKVFKDDIFFKPEETNIFWGHVESAAESSKSSSEKSELFVSTSTSPPKHDEPPNTNAPKNYTIPPPLDLFDPTPPPPDLDWDAGSDSGESDTFSLTDGILSRTNFNQSQARSSLFDEAPPSLDANDSSGIVRDLNVTRVEIDDSSFYPYASSSRRLSSDIFGEQQSQDSLFVTKNRTEASVQPCAILDKISENVENVSSKIDNLTPSGNLEDFEESSVFERSKNESKASENMDYTAPVLDVKKSQGASLFKDETTDNQSGDIFAPKRLDNVKKRASLFEENRDVEKRQSTEKDGDSSETPRTSPTKTSPGKLQHNLKINVGALMPGAARPRIRPAVAKSTSSDEIDKSAKSSPPVGSAGLSRPVGGASLSPPIISRVATLKGDELDKEGTLGGNEKFENVDQTQVLQSATKDRVRIPIKRRPSTRRARQEAARKSMTDFSLYQNEDNSSVSELSSESDKIPQSPTSNDKNSFLKGLNSKLGTFDGVPKKKTSENDDSEKPSEDSPEVNGISLVSDLQNEKQAEKTDVIVENPVSKGLFDSLLEETENKPVEKTDEIVENPVSKGHFDSLLEETENKPVFELLNEDNQTDIFESESGSSKSIETLKSDSAASSSPKRPEKAESTPETKSIFEDSFEDNSDLFKNTLKSGERSSEISRKPKSNSSLFGDGGSDGSDEDLFSSTTKSLRKDLVATTDEPTKVEEIPSKKEPKSSIFSDKSDSEGDGDLFGGKPKAPAAKVGRKTFAETTKKASIFDDSDDSSEEDLFGSKTSERESGEHTGAARPKIRPAVAKSTSSDEIDKSANSSPPVGSAGLSRPVGSAGLSRPVGGASLSPPIISRVATLKSDDLDKEETLGGNEKFENVDQTQVLQSATKDRVRIPIKRRPSTRRARQEAARKSMTDFSLYQNEDNSSVSELSSESDKIPQSPTSNEKNSFLKGLNSKLGTFDGVPKKKTSENDDSEKPSEDSPEVNGISLVSDLQNEKQAEKTDVIVENPVSKGLFDSLLEETENKPVEKTDEIVENPVSKDLFDSLSEETENKPVSEILNEDSKTDSFESESGSSKSIETLKSDSAASSSPKRPEKAESTPETKSIFEDSFKDNSDLFKNTLKSGERSSEISRKPKSNSSLFGDGGSDGSDEDLFSSTTKSLRKDLVATTDEPTKVEEIPSKKEPKSSIFSDKSDSEGDGDLFGGKPKAPAAKVGRKTFGETTKKASIFDDSDDSSEEDLFGSKTSERESGEHTGAARPKIRPAVAKSTSSDEIDKSANSSPPVGSAGLSRPVGSAGLSRPVGGASLSPPIISRVATLKSDDLDKEETLGGNEKFENVDQTQVLQSATKDRVRIPIKRRPSTRRARQEAARKSMTDFSLYQNEDNSSVSELSSESDKIPQSPTSNEKNSFLKGLNSKLGTFDGVPKKKTSENDDSEKPSEDSPEVNGISLVSDLQNEKQAEKTDVIVENPVSKGLFDSLLEETENKPVEKTDEIVENPVSKDLFDSLSEETENKPVSEILNEDSKTDSFESESGSSKSIETLKSDSAASSSPKRPEKAESTPETKSIFEDSFKDNSDLFKNTLKSGERSSEISRKPKSNSSLFGDGGSDGSDEDLFSSTTKSLRKDLVATTDEPTKVEEIPSKKEPKSSIFSDKSDSEGDGDLFGGKPKAPAAKVGRKTFGETTKKASIFDDSDDSSEEDLFGSKTSERESGEHTGSVLGTRRVESKNVKIAGLKKLENKEVTDFDPLSALK